MSIREILSYIQTIIVEILAKLGIDFPMPY